MNINGIDGLNGNSKIQKKGGRVKNTPGKYDSMLNEAKNSSNDKGEISSDKKQVMAPLFRGYNNLDPQNSASKAAVMNDRIREAINQSPPEEPGRAEKVEKIKALIASGKYRVSSDLIADRIMKNGGF